MRYFCCWSGGKESALSFYLAKQQGGNVSCLLNMVTEDGNSSRTHGVNAQLLRRQAQAMGVPIVQVRSSWPDYEREFKKAVAGFRKQDITAGVFGDIDLAPHREWVERVCRESRVEARLPLWNKARQELMADFIGRGFSAIIVAVRRDVLGPEWLGRRIDEQFITDMSAVSGVDLCGEGGEYHTLVTGGPIFKEEIKISPGGKVPKGRHWFWEII